MPSGSGSRGVVDEAVASIAAGDEDGSFGMYVGPGAPAEGGLAAGWVRPSQRRRTVRRASHALSVRGAALAAMLAAALAADAAWGQAATGPNYSSHAASFFEELLAGRVWVLERPNSSLARDRGTVWAHYHAPDGRLLACAHLGGEYAGAEARWRVVPSRAFRALYNYLEPDAEPDPGRRQGHTPIFHDPETGALHNEALGGEGRWAVASRGWVQESWPQAMKEACPDLSLPATLPVNRRQTATRIDAMMAQDPDAVVRNAPGSHLRGPGATGVAAVEGRARLPAADLARFLAENDGFVLRDAAGARHVLVLGAEGDELWLLDADGGVVDTGLLVPAAGGAEIAVHYSRLPVRPRYRIGDALPFCRPASASQPCGSPTGWRRRGRPWCFPCRDARRPWCGSVRTGRSLRRAAARRRCRGPGAGRGASWW